ncbi:tetratricopeptide repeat protein [Flavobacterium sp. ALJ2]|uniref:tetratricopeptide repeat protein n=1 Tax=Flavobacterium sp. ALJ2 TaxID=2786960 RepID=UPI00189C8AFA|nr:tetratricopeptide repeat protein [Flavobacterium sp. ALJ2]MBF7091184.1 tetratricopeptide repeat protein [Flavobacterium sp. ALJ2]
MRKTVYLFAIIIALISCNKKKENEVKYKMKTNDVIFFENTGIENKTARKIFGEGLKDVDFGDYESAREKFIQADKIESKNVSILNGIAEAEFNLGNKELANKMLLNVILIDSTYVGTYINLGSNYLSTGYFEKANEILLKGKKFTSNKNLHVKSILLFNLAISYNHLADCENSLKYLDETLEISQNEDLTDSANKRKRDSEETICKNKELL